MKLSAIYSLYKPFIFSQPRNNRLWGLITLLGLGNLLQAILIVVSNNFLNVFLGILIAPPFSLMTLCWAAIHYLFTIFVYTLAAGFNSYLGDKIIESLNEVVINTFDKWLHSKTYFGARFLKERKLVNSASVFSYDIQEANRLLVRLGDSFLNTFFASLAAFYCLWHLSFPLAIEIASFVIVIPGYMAIGALVYAIVNNLIINQLAYQLEALTKKQHKLASKLEAQVHHIEKHAEGIELLNARAREQQNFIQYLKETTIYNALLAKLQAGLTAFIALNDHLRYFVGIVLCIPQLLANKMSIDNLLIVSDYFVRFTSLFTWPFDNSEELTYFKVMASKLAAIQKEMKAWEAIQQKNKLNIVPGKELAFKSLTIKRVDQTPLVKAATFEFKNDTVYLIQGPSGAGKSTIIKTINKSWPYAKGQITLPCDKKEIHIIPQKTVFPRQSTLYEAILYPRDQQLMSLENKTKIDELLIEFKFESNVINEKDQVRDWASTLSGGEQQRIAMIRAILFKPKVLLMDEPFSALNPLLQVYCEQRLRHHLKTFGTTTLLIDHRDINIVQTQSESFYDEIVYLNNRTLTRAFT